MSSTELIDAQFDRAVEIVQSLPKTGPIQTQYDEKLNMYALYKQATVGNVQGARPGMFDMLGRAKWDAWAKQKDVDPLEAKWLYVDALLKVLRKYSDKTVARTLVEELESYGGDPANLILSGSFSQSRHSGSSSSSASPMPGNRSFSQVPPGQAPPFAQAESSDSSGSEASASPPPQPAMSLTARPASSMSSSRYRTPMAGSMAMSPSMPPIPAAQPLPTFDTPSAFAGSPSSSYQAVSVGGYGGGQYAQYPASYGEHPSVVPTYRPPTAPSHASYGPGMSIGRPGSRASLELAVENVQAHLAALTERLDSLQSSATYPQSAHLSRTASRSFFQKSRGHSPDGEPIYDLDDLGLWSYVVQPAARGLELLKEAATFFARNENRTPTMVIVRRLCLDASFLFCVLAVIRFIWRKSGVRRKEVKAALGILWGAILGTKERTLVDKAV